MNQGKRRRASYRAALKDAGLVRQSRFDERIGALAGTANCQGCGLARPASALDDSDYCPVCRGRRRSTRIQIEEWAGEPSEPDVVYVDASWSEGVAGLAVVGALGSHSRVCQAPTSTAAEVMALRWAFEIAEAQGQAGLIFRSDCTAAVNLHNRNNYRLGWRVEHVPRRFNASADSRAGIARRQQRL